MRNPEASIEIAAPIEVVWGVMLDTASYGEWNPFIVRADCPSPPSVGDPITLHVLWPDGKRVVSPERISVVDAPEDGAATLAYVYEGWPSKVGLLRGTRFQRLTEKPEGSTAYHTVEVFSGPLVKLAGPGRVAEGFRRHAEALKARSESLADLG